MEWHSACQRWRELDKVCGVSVSHARAALEHQAQSAHVQPSATLRITTSQQERGEYGRPRGCADRSTSLLPCLPACLPATASERLLTAPLMLPLLHCTTTARAVSTSLRPPLALSLRPAAASTSPLVQPSDLLVHLLSPLASATFADDLETSLRRLPLPPLLVHSSFHRCPASPTCG